MHKREAKVLAEMLHIIFSVDVFAESDLTIEEIAKQPFDDFGTFLRRSGRYPDKAEEFNLLLDSEFKRFIKTECDYSAYRGGHLGTDDYERIADVLNYMFRFPEEQQYIIDYYNAL